MRYKNKTLTCFSGCMKCKSERVLLCIDCQLAERRSLTLFLLTKRTNLAVLKIVLVTKKNPNSNAISSPLSLIFQVTLC